MPTRLKIILGVLLLLFIGTGALAAINTITAPKEAASDQTKQSDSGSQFGSTVAEKDDSTSTDQDSSEHAEVSGASGGHGKLISFKGESTTGQKGSVQTFSILSQHVPKDGAKFILSSLQLSLAANYKHGTILSGDSKQVTTPAEGTYIAQSNGAIRFSPDSDFVGSAVGVGYSIVDTNGVTYGGSYSPRVTASVTSAPTTPSNPTEPVGPSDPIEPGDTCADSGSEGIRLADKHMRSSGFDMSTSLKTFDVRNGDYAMSDDGQRLYNIDYDANVVRSVDGGESWERIGPEIENAENIDGFNIKASKDGMVIILSAASFNDETFEYDRLDYRSIDGGTTWNTINLPLQMEVSEGRIAMSRSGNKMYMFKFNYGTNQVDIWQSTDKAQTWQAIAPIDAYDPSGFDISDDGETMVMSAIDPSTVYDMEPQSLIYVTTDGAATWTTSDPTTDLIGRGSISISGDGMKWSFMAIDLMTYYQKMYSTSDGGASWSSVSFPDSDLDPYTIAIARGTGKLYAWFSDLADDYKVRFFTSTNLGSSWSEVAIQPDAASNKYSVSANGTILRSAGYTEPYVSTDSGATWLPMAKPGMQFDKERIDLDPSTSQVDHIIDRTSTEGWKLTYSPELDELYFEVTDEIRISRPYTVNLNYTLAPADGCEAPSEGTLTFLLYESIGD